MNSVLEDDFQEIGTGIASHFALLAPVPEVHLKSAYEASLKRIAFGTNDFFTFDEATNQLKGMPKETRVDIYFYSPDGEAIGLSVSWHALYIGHVDAALSGVHPNGMLYRPPSTFSDAPWGMFYEVDNLQPLDKHLPLSVLTGFRKAKPLGYTGRIFVPERPMLIEHP